MGLFEKFRHKTQNSVKEAVPKEKPSFDHASEEAFRAYMEYFSLTKEDLQKPLLDIGSGNGDFIKYVRAVLGNRRAYGIEKQPAKINLLQDGMVAGDGLSLPFGDETFEIVIAKNCFPIFAVDNDKVKKVISEALRVLKSGGKMVGNISTPEAEMRTQNESNWDERARDWFDKRREGAEKLETFLKDLRESGYKVDYGEVTEKGSRKIIVTIQKPQRLPTA
ncbi:hypothetical protein A3C94_02400 [Candidatus Kaiserbacteria bacterium RIFCSPHIGHO2_02_FULL_55_17]|uniref:Methyltransferase type 11 domain-containing protein n=1 Tax=Candidatus Kaiserbacteria bacterium RIFCSPHIGHO2_02_FULL_55_17 TaxID=1798496 RepID=A0A1F6DS93_9BACT|nr:MAG: hypothetical protein UY94_C0036G0002 [Parcubacteria group bacterium GW2011_GWA2_56_21]OGG64187.1 MAG: hypothetical protein A3C94_02400 [Candidatus Kaiserbacteria bacterium RIFCSPHIGHO2_02_FULL_55_17]